jgi:hypothetical protein
MLKFVKDFTYQLKSKFLLSFLITGSYTIVSEALFMNFIDNVSEFGFFATVGTYIVSFIWHLFMVHTTLSLGVATVKGGRAYGKTN